MVKHTHSPPPMTPCCWLVCVASAARLGLGGLVVVVRVINIMESMTSVQEWFESDVMLCVGRTGGKYEQTEVIITYIVDVSSFCYHLVPCGCLLQCMRQMARMCWCLILSCISLHPIHLISNHKFKVGISYIFIDVYPLSMFTNVQVLYHSSLPLSAS